VAGVEIEVPGAATLQEGHSAGFTFRDECGMLADGFVVRHHGELMAYRNQCPHQPLSLDYGDGDFFTEDGALLLCRNHGALFDPASGRCVEGPCYGAHLLPLPVREKDGTVTVEIPPADAVPDLE
jgi:nitrite reductase/ring-hydroxylating ferredoxin subunit